MKQKKSMKHQTGMGLIEVLVTLLILSSSLLALASLQTRSLQFNQGAYLRSQANIYAYDILDRMRLNLKSLNAYESAIAMADLEDAPVTAPLAAADLDAWRRNITSTLPNGRGGIECDDTVCTVTIDWEELNTSGRDDDDEEKTTFTYSARL